MIIKAIFDKYSFDTARALEYGFIQSGDVFTKDHLLEYGLIARVTVGCGEYRVNVYEADGEEYMLFNVKDAKGGFVTSVRAATDRITEDILARCFTPCDVRDALIGYAMEKYGSQPETPWGDPDDIVIRTPNRKKWYGIFMRLPYSCLGIESSVMTNVMNVKLSPDRIVGLIDKKRYFPAYHMNKKHWLTALLDRSADVSEIKTLIDESFSIVENGVKRREGR